MAIKRLGHTMIKTFKEILPSLEKAQSQSENQRQVVINNVKGMAFAKIYFQAPAFIARIEKENTEE